VGVRLEHEVMDHAPAHLTTAERLVLIAIARAADDKTRLAYPGIETLKKWTGLTDRQIRKVLTKVEARGIDLRTTVTRDKHGDPVVATKGHRTVYRVPDFRPESGAPGRPCGGPKGGTRGPPLGEPKAELEGPP
jgi:Helix-turn-helix domain